MQLEQRNNDHKQEENDGLGLTDALPLGSGACVERVVDVVGQHHRLLCRLTGRQREVLVEQLEGVRQRQEGADRHAGHDHRDFDFEQNLAACCTVNACGLHQIHRHILQTGNIDDHHVADLLPAHKDDQPPEAVGGIQRQQRLTPGGQQTVEQDLPDIAQHDAADQVRQEEDGAESVGAVHTAGEKQRDGKGQHVDQQGGHDGERRCEPERMGEGVIRPNHCVVA